jgi:hypothetical protein
MVGLYELTKRLPTIVVVPVEVEAVSVAVVATTTLKEAEEVEDMAEEVTV